MYCRTCQLIGVEATKSIENKREEYSSRKNLKEEYRMVTS
jgi:hypothetical protein